MLKTLRKNERLSQMEAAMLFGISTSHYAKIESGRRPPSLEIAVLIANYFHRSIQELFLCLESAQKNVRH